MSVIKITKTKSNISQILQLTVSKLKIQVENPAS